jgi:hypothetical protein
MSVDDVLKREKLYAAKEMVPGHGIVILQNCNSVFCKGGCRRKKIKNGPLTWGRGRRREGNTAMQCK